MQTLNDFNSSPTISSTNSSTEVQPTVLAMHEGRDNPQRLSFRDYKQLIATNRIMLREAFPARRRNITTLISSLAPKVPFKELVMWYENDSDARLAMDWTRNATIGAGFYWQAGNRDAIPIAEEFARRSQLFQKIYDGIYFEAFTYGNSLWWLEEANNYIDLNWLPISDFKRVWFDQAGHLTVYDMRGQAQRLLPSEEVIHFTWGKSNSGIYGIGLLQPLAMQRIYNVKVNDQFEARRAVSLFDAKAAILDESRLLIRRYIARNIYKFPGAGTTQLEANRSALKVLEPGEDFVAGSEVTIDQVGATGRVVDSESFMELHNAEILKALQTPASKIFTRPDFNRASADAALHLNKINMRGFGTIMADQVLNFLIKPWWRSHPEETSGITWEDAKLKMLANPTDPIEPDGQFLIAAFQSRGITLNEFRRNAENMGLELEQSPEAMPEQDLMPDTEVQLADGTTLTVREKSRKRRSDPGSRSDN